MFRTIVVIDKEACNGCGACAAACHEGAIQMQNGKAVLVREDYCDGLGDCLPACPTGAISFELRDALAYDEEAVRASKAENVTHQCQSTIAKSVSPVDYNEAAEQEPDNIYSRLKQWPVQIKLAPLNAPYFNNAKLLVAADCTAFAYGDFHRKFMENHVTLIGCPKLDQVDYSEKLSAIISQNAIQSIVIARMEVPCCGGLENAVKRAIALSGKNLSCEVVTISTDGRIL